MDDVERVLSIQSHVVFGYVGGKAAVFSLQCLGYDVDVVHTVNFSNHSGYGRVRGTKTSAEELDAIFAGMEANELLQPTRLLTGAEALAAVAKLAQKLKLENPSLIYLLDPVMGDSGRLYVTPDVVPLYRQLIALASIITPNWFEMEVLTGIKLEDLSSLRRALTVLHRDYRVPKVVMSSMPLSRWLLSALPITLRPVNNEYLLCLSSSISHAHPGGSIVHARCVPLIPGYFSGVGDLFSALLLGHFHPHSMSPDSPSDTPLSFAVSQALSKVHAVLKLTYKSTCDLPEDERLPPDDHLDTLYPLRKARRMRGRELALIKGQDIIRGTDALGEQWKMEVWSDFWQD